MSFGVGKVWSLVITDTTHTVTMHCNAACASLEKNALQLTRNSSKSLFRLIDFLVSIFCNKAKLSLRGDIPMNSEEVLKV